MKRVWMLGVVFVVGGGCASLKDVTVRDVAREVSSAVIGIGLSAGVHAGSHVLVGTLEGKRVSVDLDGFMFRESTYKDGVKVESSDMERKAGLLGDALLAEGITQLCNEKDMPAFLRWARFWSVTKEIGYPTVMGGKGDFRKDPSMEDEALWKAFFVAHGASVAARVYLPKTGGWIGEQIASNLEDFDRKRAADEGTNGSEEKTRQRRRGEGRRVRRRDPRLRYQPVEGGFGLGLEWTW